MSKAVRYILVIISFVYTETQAQKTFNDAAALHRAQQALTDIIVHDIFSPTGASRIYAYSNIAAYEILVKGKDNYVSLYGQLAGFPEIVAPIRKVDLSLAGVTAFLLTGKKLVYSDDMVEDSMEVILHSFKKKKLHDAVYRASILYGKQVADSILKWVSQDRYSETRKMRRYNLLKQEGAWSPTPPAYMAAVEPYWNIIRPLTLDSATQFRPSPALAFGKDSSSRFYKEAYEVYQTVNTLNNEQRNIANFWDCNPFFLNVGGHLNFASKKISPGGHWMSIAGLACQKTNADITRSAAAYTLTAIAMFDGFICCWDEKFRSNLVRPETYINATIDENWRPLLQTPPFPEYPSGHSVISTAAAIVLSHFFSDNFAFEDDTEIKFGLPKRKFNSFKEAAEEAAMSRLYGGIHYKTAIVNGQTQGRAVGNWVLEKVRLARVDR